MTQKKTNGTLSRLTASLLKLLGLDGNKATDSNAGDPASETETEFRINDVVTTQVKTIINDFIEAAPLIEAAGFRISTLEIELSVIPKLIPHFEKIDDVDDTLRAQIIDQVQDKRIIRLLLKALYKADNFQKSLRMGTLEFACFEIEITAIPAIRLIYKNPLSTTVSTTTDIDYLE